MPEERKLVSVLFVDVVGSTSLGEQNDPEVVRAVLATYFDRMRDIADAHGGTVEKFIGDAVMAVFGVPRLHDDDAERAVRAALAMRDGMEALDAQLALHVDARIGVNSGEAVAAVDGLQQSLVTGDVVNVAARLQQAAGVGEILVGALTEALTREAIEYLPREAVVARGKTEPIPAFLAVRPRTAVPEQARGLPGMRARLVGRERELRLLVETFERAQEDRRAQLFTLIGGAGVGKSRLVGEFLARVTARTTAHVLRGRCLPYGTGITYWPLMEMLQADLGMTPTDGREIVRERLDARLRELFPDERERSAVANRTAVLLGLADAAEAVPDVSAARLPAELGWGLRRYLEALAAGQATIAVVDDLQWADPVVVEILGGIVDRSVDVPLVVVAIARPELLERYPAWGAGRPNATLIALEPLNEAETKTLIGRLLDVEELPDDLRTRIVVSSGGNPLFCEEFLRMLIDEGRVVRVGDGWRALTGSLDVRVPESIQALLAARLDGLGADEKRSVLAASIIGEQFELDELRAIAGVADLDAALERLERAAVILEDRARARPGAYRFRHLLIRDVAYGLLSKAERAGLHEAFAGYLAEAAGGRNDLVELRAYHAERALRLSLEVRISGAALARRAAAAQDLSLAAAERAVAREDSAALATFLETCRTAAGALGTAVAPGDAARRALLEGRLEALRGNYVEARGRLVEATAMAEQAGRPDLAAAAQHALATVLVFSFGSDADEQELLATIARATALYDRIGDIGGRLSTELLGLEELFGRGDLSEMLARGTALAERAMALGDRGRAAAITARLITTAAWLGRPALAESLADRAEALANELALRSTLRRIRFYRTRIRWMHGDLAAAEAMATALVAENKENGDSQFLIASLRILGETLIDAGRPEEADAALSTAVDASVSTGERWSRTELLAYRARVAISRGDLDAADRFVLEAQETVRSSDPAAQAALDGALGAVRAAQGRVEEAEAAFRHGVDLIRATEYWWWAYDALDLVQLLVSTGRRTEAAQLFADVEAAWPDGYAIRAAQRDRIRETLSRQLA